MIKNQPEISIIMPVYNTENYVGEAIESVINQTFLNWELICVNDGSTDNSINILHKYKALDNRIIVIDQVHSGKAAIARNTALNVVSGNYIHMLDSDDMLKYDFLEKAFKVSKSMQADLVMPDLISFKDDVNNITDRLIGYCGDRQVVLSNEQAFFASLSWDIPGVGLFNTDLVKRYRFDTNGKIGDEYTTRLLILNSNKIVFFDSVYYFRRHSASTTTKISLTKLDYMLNNDRLLELAYEYNQDKMTISKCKNNIVWEIINSMSYLTKNEIHFSRAEKNEAEEIIKKYYLKIDNSYFVKNEKMNRNLLIRFIFVDFRIIKFYSYYKVKIRPFIKQIICSK